MIGRLPSLGHSHLGVCSRAFSPVRAFRACVRACVRACHMVMDADSTADVNLDVHVHVDASMHMYRCRTCV